MKTPTPKKTTTKKSIAKNTSLEAQVYSLEGAVTGTTPLNEEVFGQKPNEALLAQYVRVYLHNQRQGNASAKTRAEVAGTTKKIYKQKGTGRARHASDKANLFRGGGATFGPIKRDFQMAMNAKQKRKALYVALSQKRELGTVKVLDATTIAEKPKTKVIVTALSHMTNAKKSLFVLSKVDSSSFVRSARNIQGVEIAQAHTLNAYQVLNTREIIFVNDALETFVSHFITT